MTTKPVVLASILLFALLTGCGPAGKITGKVAVEGGQAGKVLVRVLGPTSKAVLTTDSGDFTAEGLADGEYQVIAEVPNTEVTEQRAYVKVTNGSADNSPTLSFKVPGGQLSGKVVFADGSDASGLTVTLSGTDTRGAQTDSAGSYSFTGLRAGAYLISAEVPGSREGRQSVSVLVGGATGAMIPDLTFTLLGTLTGNVKAGTTNAPNVAVNVPGTELFTLTDANGDFILRNVPTGMRTVQARLNSATATQNVTVVKGDNTPLAFTLQTALTGTVEGSVGFMGNTIDTGITVSAAGTTFSTTVAANGDFRLTLPPGAWELVADARLYPRKSLGVHFVSPGATTRVPTAKMTLFRRLPFDGPVSGALVSGARGVCEGDYVLASVTVNGTSELHVIDTNLLNRRLIVANTAGLSGVAISPRCRWVVFGVGDFVGLHNVTTGEQRLIYAGLSGPSNIEISTDETVVFYRANNNLLRYNIATGNTDTFPATNFVQVSRDRYLVGPAGSPANFQLVTTTGAATTAFSNATATAAHGGAAYSFTDCTVVVPLTCTLRTLGTTGTTIYTYATASVPNTTTFDNGNSTGEYYHFRTSATASILVRTSSGAGIAMPASTTLIRYNPSGTRMAYLAPNTAQALREEALPGTGAVAPAATSTGTFSSNFNYVSDTRLIAFDTDATPQKVDIKSGTAAIDTDVTTVANGPFVISGSVATWGRASTSKRMALLADGTDQILDFPAATQPPFPFAASVAPMGVTTMPWVAPRYGAVSPDVNTVFVIDATRNEVRKLNGLIVQAGQPANVFSAMRPVSGELGYLVPAYDQFLWLREPGTEDSGFTMSVLQPTVGLTTLFGETGFLRDLLVHRIGQQP